MAITLTREAVYPKLGGYELYEKTNKLINKVMGEFGATGLESVTEDECYARFTDKSYFTKVNLAIDWLNDNVAAGLDLLTFKDCNPAGHRSLRTKLNAALAWEDSHASSSSSGSSASSPSSKSSLSSRTESSSVSSKSSVSSASSASSVSSVSSSSSSSP